MMESRGSGPVPHEAPRKTRTSSDPQHGATFRHSRAEMLLQASGVEDVEAQLELTHLLVRHPGAAKIGTSLASTRRFHVSKTFRVGEYLVELDLNRISVAEADEQIEPRSMEVLVYLAERAGEVVGKEHLVRAVWQDTFVADGAAFVVGSGVRTFLRFAPGRGALCRGKRETSAGRGKAGQGRPHRELLRAASPGTAPLARIMQEIRIRVDWGSEKMP